MKNFTLFLLLVFSQLGLFAQDNMLCQGAYWTEDQANVLMKKWASEWNTRADWEKRAGIIRQGNHQRDEVRSDAQGR